MSSGLRRLEGVGQGPVLRRKRSSRALFGQSTGSRSTGSSVIGAGRLRANEVGKIEYLLPKVVGVTLQEAAEKP